MRSAGDRPAPVRYRTPASFEDGALSEETEEQGWATAKTPVWLPGTEELAREPLPYRRAA